MTFKEYITSFFSGLRSLLVGMGTTIKVFFRRKTTEQYPENRATLKISDRFRGELVMNCPNGTINVVTKQVTDEETGKARKVLDRYEYDLGSCLFCQLCVRTCPHDAIEFINTYEHAVFTRGKLREQLNHEGSTLAKK